MTMISTNRWFGRHHRKETLPPSPVVPLAAKVRKQAEDLRRLSLQLNTMIAAREAKDDKKS